MKKQQLLVISSFPRKGETHGQEVVGVASYAKNTLTSLTRNFKNLSVTVLAEELEGESEYTEKRITVKRIWKRNSFGTFFNLLKEIISNHKRTKTVMIEFELSMFGDTLHLILLPIFLLILKLLNKKVVLVSHQVISDINEISGQINIKNEGTIAMGLNALIRFFYSICLPLCSKVIVFDEIFKEQLEPFTNKKRLVVIPHGVDKITKKVNKYEVLKKLRLTKKQFVVLVFGFIAWYKGTDIIVHAFREFIRGQKRNWHYKLIIAGGANPNHLDKEYYNRYIKSIKTVSHNHGIRVTGFVPEKQIGLYYQASDVVVFPYRTFMSASGPLSIAFSYQKPVLLSSNLKDLFKTRDMKETTTECELEISDFLFDDTADLRKKLMRIETNKTLKKKLITFAKHISKKRAWDLIANSYYEQVFN
jgi:glycosyltransferase involved in cell wall biosynthesis